MILELTAAIAALFAIVLASWTWRRMWEWEERLNREHMAHFDNREHVKAEERGEV